MSICLVQQRQQAETATAKINFDSTKAHLPGTASSTVLPHETNRETFEQRAEVRAREWIYVSVALNRKQSSRIYTLAAKFVGCVCVCACVSAEIIGFISDGIGQIVILPIVSALACAHRIFIGRLRTREATTNIVFCRLVRMLCAVPILWTTEGANNIFFSLESAFDPCAVGRFCISRI